LKTWLRRKLVSKSTVHRHTGLPIWELGVDARHPPRLSVRPQLLLETPVKMSPIRRYLRITKYSVLEVRIYLDKPSDTAWLLSSRDPVLPRVIEEVRPKVLPKLREENENAKKKGGKKKKGIKDVAGQGQQDSNELAK
jgi:hypothetical protein